MNKSQQFILSEHLEELKDASQFTSFLATKRVDTLTFEEVAELWDITVLLDGVISRIEKLSKTRKYLQFVHTLFTINCYNIRVVRKWK